MFYLTVVIYLLGAIIYLIFGSGERQSWADEEQINEVGESGKSIKSVKDSSYKIKQKETCEVSGMPWEKEPINQIPLSKDDVFKFTINAY